MNKKNFFKAFGFSSLALLIGFGAIMPFNPLSTFTPVVGATTETGGLITPKADDPIIYTTESGINIKYGNAVPITSNSSLGSGNLKGFPYFTTKNGSTTYTWVIIGRNPSLTNLSTAVERYLFSTWKTNNSSSDSWKYSKPFFANTYETSTPAGSLINSVISSSTYVNDNISMPINSITSNNEIPSGSVLCLSNSIIESCMFYAGSDYETWNGQPCIATAAQTFAGASNTVRTKCANYYTNDTFGFGTYKSSLQNITLKQNGCYDPGQYSSYHNATNGNAYFNTFATTQLYFFPLATNNAGYYDYTKSGFTGSGSNVSYTESNFCVQTYLSASQFATTDTTWTRNMHATAWPGLFSADGAYTPKSGIQVLRGVRPACVIKI